MIAADSASFFFFFFETTLTYNADVLSLFPLSGPGGKGSLQAAGLSSISVASVSHCVVNPLRWSLASLLIWGTISPADGSLLKHRKRSELIRIAPVIPPLSPHSPGRFLPTWLHLRASAGVFELKYSEQWRCESAGCELWHFLNILTCCRGLENYAENTDISQRMQNLSQNLLHLTHHPLGERWTVTT